MLKIRVSLKKKSYSIKISDGLLKNPNAFSFLKPGAHVIIVTNQTLAPILLDTLTNTLNKMAINVDKIILPDGEKYKTFESINYIFDELLKKLYSRDTTLIALGGGVIGDLTGFAAAIYQRGISFIQVPTTLLAQVDAAIGGKTGINHSLGKNMIGAFYQPQSVIIDTNCLISLPTREFVSGMAEVIKYAIIFDNNFFCWLEDNVESLISLDNKALKYCIYRCCELKANIVSYDEKELLGARILLNLGHTFGHAIEAYMGYGTWLHGEAISAGMIIAARVSELLNEFKNQDTNRIIKLLKRVNLPFYGPSAMEASNYLSYMQRDKKVLSRKIQLILPQKIGMVKLRTNIPSEIIIAAINDCKSYNN